MTVVPRPCGAPRIDELGGHDVLDDVAHRLVDGDLVARSCGPGARPSRTSPISVALAGSRPCELGAADRRRLERLARLDEQAAAVRARAAARRPAGGSRPS